MNQLIEMNTTGDTEHSWDPDSPDEVEAARKTFKRLKKKGYIAYRVDQGEKASIMTNFDPSASQIIMSPMAAGG